MDNWVSFIIGDGLVNEFEKRKTNMNIEYNFGIQFLSFFIFLARGKENSKKEI